MPFIHDKRLDRFGRLNASKTAGDVRERNTRSISSASDRLPEQLVQSMSGPTGVDLSAVRLHRGGLADELNVKAVAKGDQIHLARDQPGPQTTGGRELLSHEIAHVGQQAQGRVPSSPRSQFVDDRALESQADAFSSDPSSAGFGGGLMQPAPAATSPMQAKKKSDFDDVQLDYNQISRDVQSTLAQQLENDLAGIGAPDTSAFDRASGLAPTSSGASKAGKSAGKKAFPIKIKYTAAPSTPVIRNDLDAKTLGSMSERHGHKDNATNHGGVCKAEHAELKNIKYKDITIGGTKKYYVESAHIHLSYTKMILFIAKEYSQGSREFELTKEHEMKHVTDYNQTLTDIQTDGPAILKGTEKSKSLVEPGKPLATKSAPQKSTQQVGITQLSAKDENMRWPQAFKDAMTAMNKKKYINLDSAAEYKRVYTGAKTDAKGKPRKPKWVGGMPKFDKDKKKSGHGHSH